MRLRVGGNDYGCGVDLKRLRVYVTLEATLSKGALQLRVLATLTLAVASKSKGVGAQPYLR